MSKCVHLDGHVVVHSLVDEKTKTKEKYPQRWHREQEFQILLSPTPGETEVPSKLEEGPAKSHHEKH